MPPKIKEMVKKSLRDTEAQINDALSGIHDYIMNYDLNGNDLGTENSHDLAADLPDIQFSDLEA